MSSPDNIINQKKQQALAHLQNQQLVEAKSLLVEICDLDNTDADAWHMLGTVNGMLGLFDECASCSRRVIQLLPEAFAAYNNLGGALMAQDKDKEARGCFDQSIQINPDNAETLNYLGSLSMKQSAFQEAETYLQKAISLAPNYAEAHYNLGIACQQSGKLEAAESALQKACTLQPGSPQLLYALATVQHAAMKLDPAIASCRSALQLDPDNAHYHTGLGNLYNDAGDYRAAAEAFGQATRCMPQSAEAHYNLGHALQAADEFEDAVQSYQQAISLKPDLVVAYNNLGQAYESQGKLNDALACFQHGLQKIPAELDTPESMNALSTAPADGTASPVAEIHWHRALLRLLMGNFSEGWPEYEWRWAGNALAYRPFPQPRWEGEALDGKTILVYAEQGVGDELMFASCIPDLISQAGHVIIDCDARLVPLYERSFPGTTVHGGTQTDDPSWLDAVPTVDVQAAIGSLPLHLRIDKDNPPPNKPYLVPEAAKLEKWRKRFDAVGPGLKVGISWRGGNPKKMRHRSTPLTLWARLLKLPDVHFVNLQYGNCEQELADVKQSLGVDVHNWQDADPMKDLDDFSAQIGALDLVISIDNSTVHMAGAVGTPTWTLLPFAPEWRWLVDQDDSYWYPDMRLFRQHTRGDWDKVFEDVFRKLSDTIHRHKEAT